MSARPVAADVVADAAPARWAAAAHADWLPAETPLHTPVTPVEGKPAAAVTPRQAARDMRLRRWGMLAVTLLLAAEAWRQPFMGFVGNGVSPLEALSLLLFAPLLIGISCWFVSAVAGFCVLWGDKGSDLDERAAPTPPRSRTALLCPVYNEDPKAVMARLAAMDRALAAQSAAEQFDIFLLSDTTDAAVIPAEEQAFQRFHAHSLCRAYYRRRASNAGRKAGNILDWVRRFGGGYEQMVILDADSVMSGETLIRLVNIMERRPDVGLVQTAPVIVGAETLFSRYVQFGVRLYGRVAAAGLAWWTGSEGSYWGHNAVLRVRAFAENAALPTLPGKGVLSGELMSHDVVEACFMRRGGWGVRMIPDMGGSYEETPPTLVDHIKRDRRWCQGNLQHSRLLRSEGLHGISRLHLVMGIMAYLVSPIWFLCLIVTAALRFAEGAPPEAITHVMTGIAKAAAEREANPLAWVTIFTSTLLFGPKILGAILVMSRPAERRAFGGPVRLSASVVAEAFLSMMAAPLMMLTQTRAMVELALNRDSGWMSQRRRMDGRLGWGAAIRAHGWQSAFGLALTVALLPFPDLALWMSPILLGLILSAAFVRVTSSHRLGQWSRALGLFHTPEERAPPAILRAVHAEEQRAQVRLVEPDAPAAPLLPLAQPVFAAE